MPASRPATTRRMSYLKPYIPEQYPDWPRPGGWLEEWGWPCDPTWVPADQIKCDLGGKTNICSCINFPPRNCNRITPSVCVNNAPTTGESLVDFLSFSIFHLSLPSSCLACRLLALTGSSWLAIGHRVMMANAWFPRRTPHYAVYRLFTAFILVRIPLYDYSCTWCTEEIPLPPVADTIDEDGCCCIYQLHG